MVERGRGGPRIVLVHRYFHPDTPPYAHILSSIADALTAAGMQVTVLTCQPSYNRAVVDRAPAHEVVNGVEIVRWKVINDRSSTIAKIINLVLFAGRLLLARRHFRRADVVMAATTPPVLIAFVCSLIAKREGAQFVYHKQDIYPEVVAATGSQSNKVLNRVLKAIDSRTDRRAARVVVLSDDMKRTSMARGTREDQVTVINNFDPWKHNHDVAQPARQLAAELTIVFAGNLGRFQGLDRLMEVIRATADDADIAWHFFGEGPVKEQLIALAAQGCNVVMHGYRAADEVAAFVARADLGVVSLHPGVIAAAYPSKTMTYLRQGCPILALVDAHSELEATVRDNRIGLAFSGADPHALAAQLRQLARDKTPMMEARDRARTHYLENFAEERQVRRWVRLMEEVATS